MTWNHAAALAGLVLLALPVAVHLLIRRHADRVLFPAMRFVPAVRAAAVRLRAPSDRALLALRLAIAAAAVLATAQPVMKTAARQRAWEARLARAVVVDTSASVPADTAASLADQAAQGAFVARRFAASDLRDAVHRATEWLERAPAAQRTIVIVSDFQRGALDDADVAAVPSSIGIDYRRAGPPRVTSARTAIDGWRGSRWTATLALDEASTQMAWTRIGAAGPPPLTVRGAEGDRKAIERAVEAARSFGVPAADPVRRVDLAFAGAASTPDTPPVTPWIAAAAIALHRSALLAETGAPVRVGERDGVMAITTTLAAGSGFAPAVIRAALLAASPSTIDREAETASVDDRVLARWRRAPAPAGPAVPQVDDNDGRWLWALALALLIVEAAVRRGAAAARTPEARSLRASGDTHADAA